MAKNKQNPVPVDAPVDEVAPDEVAPDEVAPDEPDEQDEAGDAVHGRMTPISKISVSSVYGAIAMKSVPSLFIGTLEDPQPNPDCELLLCRIAGYASTSKHGVSGFGPWGALVGDFAATNYTTGEIFISKVCMVPGPTGEALIETLTGALARDSATKIKFSVDVYIKRSPREPDKKYVYIVRPVVDTAFSTPSVALLGMS